MPREHLYEKLAQKLAREIGAGKYPIGSLLPKELDLMQMENVSRHTVRAALEKLEKYGIIKRTPHVGTRVVGRGRVSSIDQQLSSLSDLDRLAVRCPRRLIDVREVVVSNELAPKIHCPPGETLLRFSMVRQVEDGSEPPIAWTTEYVKPEWRSLIPISRENPDQLMIELICTHFKKRCVEVRQTIEATTLSEEAAKNLASEVGAPALRIYRRYVSDKNRVLLITVSYHPSERYAFNINVRVDG